jgi:hypothetical protein
VRAGLLLVVCDNTGLVSVLDPGLALPGPHREIPLRGGRGRGYEDIAADPATRRLFVLVEAVPNDRPGGPPYQPAAPSATPGPRQAGQPRPSRSTSRSTTSPPTSTGSWPRSASMAGASPTSTTSSSPPPQPARPPSTCSSPPGPWKPHSSASRSTAETGPGGSARSDRVMTTAWPGLPATSASTSPGGAGRCDSAGPTQRRQRRACHVTHLVIRVKRGEMQRHVAPKVLGDPRALGVDLGVRIVVPRERKANRGHLQFLIRQEPPSACRSPRPDGRIYPWPENVSAFYDLG